MVYYSSKPLEYTTKNQQAYHAVAGTDHETSKKYKLQHTNAFVSYNSKNECLFGCKLFVGRLAQWRRTNFVLPHWVSPSSIATRPSGHKKGDFRPCNMVRHDICQHNYAVETGLVVGLCGQPHYCYQPYYPTARFLSPSSSITFLWSWPATDHEPHCRHVPINKIWMRTESTPWSGWRIRMGGIYSDCSTRKINKFKGKAPYTNSIQVWSATRRQGPDFQNFLRRS